MARLCKRQFVMMISAMLMMCKLVATIRADGDYDDSNLDDFDVRDDERCIPTSRIEHSEVEERGMFIKESQTSFIPSYCKRKPSPSDHELKAGRNRLRRSKKVDDGFHLASLHSLPHDEVRLAQAKIMKRYMNASVNPCDDFYNYACGNWARYNEIPKDKVASDTFEILRESLDEALKELLVSDEKESAHKPRGRKQKRNQQHHRDTNKQRRKNAETKAKNLFRSCMNYEAIEKRGIEPLLELLETFGGWPLLDDSWDEKNFDWLKLTALLRKYNNDILIVEWVGADIQNSNHNVIQVSLVP